MSNSKKVNEKWSKKDYRKSSKRVYSRSDKAITLIALIVTIIVLLILAGVTINLAVNNQGIFNKAKTATGAYKNASEEEEASLALLENEIDKYIPKNDDSKVSEEITYTENGETKTLTKGTPAGTKIGTTANIDGQTLDWYLFDVSDDGKTAYLVSTPTHWVPDTNSVVNGAYTPKLVSNSDTSTGALRQAIKYGKNYTPSVNTLSYYKSVNRDWAKSENGRSTQEFSKWNENEQEACYVADADIFEGIKDQVNNANGNLKGKIKTLVGGASAEQWCKAYNKQTIVKEKQPNGGITCEYSTMDTPGYIYKVNGTVQNLGWYTDVKTIVGNDIYGAAYTYSHTNNPFYSAGWWLASPSAWDTINVCTVKGSYSYLYNTNSDNCYYQFSLLASVSL